MSGFGNRLNGAKGRIPQMQYLQVYDPRQAMRNRRYKYKPLTLKPVEEVEGSSSATHHLHHAPDSGGGGPAAGPSSSSSSSSPLPPPLALRRHHHHHHPMMVDSTGIGPGPSSGPPGQNSASTAGEDTTASGAAGGTMSEGSASESSPRQSGVQSLVTSREEDGEDDAQGGEGENASGSGSKRDSVASSDKSPGQRAPPLANQSRSKSVGEQKWQNLRAVIALYTRLRKIKRTKSNQRWMKLRTTVQLSGAITTIQKKPPLKREDSFLKRFSTRQIPETQETVDTGDDGDGGPSSHSTASTRRRRQRRKPLPRTVVNPDENFYFYWLFVLSVCVLYNLWTLIVRQSFPELQQAATVLWFTCDGFSDTVFLLDIAVQFRTGYLEQGLMVYNSKKLAGHYIRSRAFLMDLCSLLPLDFLQFYLGVQPILRFPRFLKVYRVYDYYYMVESRTVYPNLWRVVNLVHILLILAHWFGCFYYLLSEAEGFIEGWAYPYHKSGYQELTRKYLGSLYWSTLTLTTIGDLPTPETNAEYVFTIVSYLIGVFIFATIVGQVGNVITNRNANRLEFERLLDGAKTYMRHHKVPGGMKRRVLRWYDYSWSRGRIQGGGDINTALGLLPDKLKTELALHVNLSVLKKVTIFQECQPEFLHDLVLKMKAYIFTPGDLICRKGEVAREMFIIADGILEVISETGRVLTTMNAGDFFGEIGILNLDGLNKRTADVRSVGYSELFSLSREDVLAAMKDYPEAQEILQSLGRKRLMEARNVSRPKSSHRDKGGSTTTGVPGAKDGTAGADGDGRAGKRIVEKLRNDVKGLKNVLRKSRRGARTKDESMELQPLNPGTLDVGHHSSSHSGKGVLRRMSRVRSDENYSREESLEDQPAATPTAKIGEGLPLLHRLHLLKEKQDREERGKPLLTPTSPPPVTGTLSPPALKLQPPDEPKASQEPEVIGAGLPLIQRLLLLKQKEERERLAVQATATVAADVLASTVKSQQETESKSVESSISPPGRKGKGSSDESRHSSSSKEQSEDESGVISRKPSLLNRLVAVKHKDSSASGGKQSSASSAGVSPQQKSDANSSTSAEPSTSTTPAPKVPLFREKLKLLTQKDNTMPSSSTSSTSTVTSPPKVQAQTSAKSDVETSSATSAVPVLKKQHSWSLLKKASILSSQNSAESSKAPTSRTATSQTSLTISEQVQSDGKMGSELREELTEDLKRTASSDETKVITVNEKSDSDSIPSKTLSPSSKTSEVGSVKSVSLFKQKMAKLTGDISVPQSSKVQDKLKTGETQAIAQGEGKTEEDNKQEGKPSEDSECPKETESISDTTKASETQTTATLTEPSTSTAIESSSPLKRRAKPNLLRLQEDTKFYMSIDDLSPEYSGLPFVKKLKILNERQKLAELEQKVAHVLMRSSSLDSGNTGAGVCADSLDYTLDPTNLTRSHSEASAMQFVRSQQRTRSAFMHASSQTPDRRDVEDGSLTPPQRPTELPQSPLGEAPQSLASPESNETLERRNLKSILKKLSASSLFSGSSEDTTKGSGSSGEQPEPVVPAPSTEQTSTVDMRKLMRAPTIEGYAARHSKLTKSVTFNRDTLQSPPATAITPTRLAEEPSGSLFPLPATSDDQTESMSTSATTVSAVVTSVVISSEAHSSTSSTTPIAQEQILSAVTTAVTVALTTTVTSAVSSTDSVGTTKSTASLVSSPASFQKTAAEPSSISAPAVSTTSDDPSLLPPPPPPLAEVIESSSPLKKKSPVSFLVQHPQIPLSANEKNFFRPSLLLPSHASLEEEYFNEVIVGIKQVIQGHLEEIQNKFQTQFQSLELEVKRRDEIISQLQKRIHELEHPDSTEILNGDDEDASEADDESDQPFMRGDSVDTVLASPPPTLPDDNLEDEVEDRTESEQLLADERPYQRIVSPPHSGLRQRQMYRRSWEDHSEEETMELLDLPRSMSPQHVWCAEDEEEEEKPGVPRDCVALDLGSSDSSSSSSSSSDSSNDGDDMFGMDDDLQTVGHNRDWEVQMLARELERREDISRLEDEVRDLKAAVSSSDLSLLSSSELDILEQVLTAKDRKVRAAARALSLDSDDSYSEERSLHPMSRHKPDLRSSSLSSSLNKRRLLKQRSTNGGGSIENLLYRTSLLKNRLLSATTRRHQLLNARSLDESPETSQKTSVSTVEHRRNRRASSGSIPVTRPQFTLPSAASSLMRGLGNLVRTSSGSTTSQTTSHHTRQSTSSLESAGSDRSTVPTISRSCGQVSPDPSHHTNDPPPPDL